MASGIYKIENIVDGKFYVGSAVDISRRWRNHVHSLNTNKHPNKHLRLAWQKYGSENFRFTVLEYCEKKQTLEREQHYIDSLDACACGYNFCPVAGSNLGVKWGEEWLRKRSLAMKGKTASEETKRKMSIAQKKRRSRPDQHLPRSPEVVEKMRATMIKKGTVAWNKGLKTPDDIRKRLSILRKGCVVSIETRRKLSEAATADWQRRKMETAGHGDAALQLQGG